MERILLVEDATNVQVLVRAALKESFNLSVASTVAEAHSALSQGKFDLILLDVKLPDGDGFGFCAELQASPEHKKCPIFFLTGETASAQKVQAFLLGGDDYIVKPFDPIELKARITAKLKKIRDASSVQGSLSMGDIRMELLSRRVSLMHDTKKEEEINLSPIEFKILNYFLKHPSHVLNREQLIDLVWGNGVSVLDRTIDSHMSHLRKKLKNSQFTVRTIYGVGYTFGAKDQ